MKDFAGIFILIINKSSKSVAPAFNNIFNAIRDYEQAARYSEKN